MRALIGTALIAAFSQWDFLERDIDPGAVRNNSGNTVLYDHRHECWTGPKPSWAPEVPGHVIMRITETRHHENWFYGGKKWVDLALEDVFETNYHNVFVVAFCN